MMVKNAPPAGDRMRQSVAGTMLTGTRKENIKGFQLLKEKLAWAPRQG